MSRQNVYTNIGSFEWHWRKNEINIIKHGFDFAEAPILFDNPVLLKIDNRQDYGEKRIIAVGRLHESIVSLVYTMRKRECCRIISLRKARKDEKRSYYSWLQRYEKQD